MKILLLDIETSPMTAMVFGLWDQNINFKNIITEGTVLCWAAKWYGEDKMQFDSVHKSKPRDMIKGIHALLDEADATITYNGINFDHKHLNSQFLLHGLKPPSSYKTIDLLRTMKGRFKFPSNKLDYITRRLKIGAKTDHEGMELWKKCMAGQAKAWRTMESYNKNDVLIMEETYKKVLPWIKNHPNMNHFSDEPCCNSCGSLSLQKRGYGIATTGTYQKYQCKTCGSWSQGTHILHKRVGIKAAL